MDAVTVFWVAGMVVTAAAVVVAIRRKSKPEQWHEQPCRSYRPELDDEPEATP